MQKICPLPIKFIYDFSYIRVIPNPQFFGSRKLAWYTCKLFIFFTVIFSIGRIYWVITNWNCIEDFEQSCLYLLLRPITIIGWKAFAVFENHLDEIIFLITQLFKIVPHNCGKTTVKMLKNIQFAKFCLFACFYLGEFKRPYKFFIRFCVWQSAQSFLAVPLILENFF